MHYFWKSPFIRLIKTLFQEISIHEVNQEFVSTCIGPFQTIHDDLVIGDALSLVDAVLV